MRRTLSQTNFENMLAECVKATINEMKYGRRNRRVSMNEAQMRNYVQNIINEELYRYRRFK